MSYFTRLCAVCNAEFTSSSKRAVTCSKKCSIVHSNQKTREKLREANNIKYAEIPDIPTCVICGWKSINLTGHLKIHKLTTDEYRAQYNTSESDVFHSSYTDMKSDRISGNKNPGFQHGGTMSAFSKNFRHYDGLADGEKQAKIDKSVAKACISRDENDSCPTRIEYYLKQGMSHDEAAAALSKRQSTFSLEKCIAKFGADDGTAVWTARQEKWLSSPGLLDLKSKGFSKISQELFRQVDVGIQLPCYYATNGDERINNEWMLRTRDGIVKLDFFVPGTGHIIEFDGDYWHSDANPHNISSEVRDAKILLSFPTYKIMHVFEGAYKKDKQGTINKCLEFLKS